MPLDHYAVVGNPISHSLSPMIHRLFAEQTGESIQYDAQLVAIDKFNTSIKQFFSSGKGLNVTVPFKEEAWQFAEKLTPRAERAGAVNTLWLSDGAIYGDTTDGVGLINDLKQNLQAKIASTEVLVIGAGGAVKGVIESLLNEQPKRVVIANRTAEKAKELAAEFKPMGSIDGCGLNEVVGHFDIVINGTSASLQGGVPELSGLVLDADTLCYDMMYSAAETPFIQWAKNQGAKHCSDGLGMLVEQAAESFSIWRHIRPETVSVLNTVRAHIQKMSANK